MRANPQTVVVYRNHLQIRIKQLRLLSVLTHLHWLNSSSWAATTETIRRPNNNQNPLHQAPKLLGVGELDGGGREWTIRSLLLVGNRFTAPVGNLSPLLRRGV